MQVTARQIAALLGGHIIGNEEVLIHKPSKIEEGEPGSICFLANPKYESYLYSTNASVVLVSENFSPSSNINPTLIKVKDVYASVATLLEHFSQYKKKDVQEVSDKAVVDSSATLEEGVFVGHYAIIEKNAHIGKSSHIQGGAFIGKNVRIGKNCTIHSGVKIQDDCIVGDNCILHSNVVIGSDGFGFAPSEDGTYKKIPQVGNVIIEDNVEIGANTTIDRATMGSTVIRKGVKLDNLIMIAHNVEIGENTVIAAQTGIAGSTKIGKNCRIGGQVGIVGHIRIADGVQIQAQSGVAGTIDKENSAWYGSPAIPYSDYLRSYAVFKILPEIKRTIDKLTKS